MSDKMKTAKQIVDGLKKVLRDPKRFSKTETDALNEAIFRIAAFGDEVWVSGESVYRNAKCIDAAHCNRRCAT